MQVNKFDVLYQVLLNSMDHEQTIALRKAYSQQFSLFGDIFGITMLRHLKVSFSHETSVLSIILLMIS